MASANRIHAIDAARIVSALGVVVIHTGGSKFITILAELFRFAVPVFFLLSGYFWYSDKGATRIERTKTLLSRIGILYITWAAIYFATNPLTPSSAHEYSMVDVILGGGPGYHLWFLNSLLQGAVLISILWPLGIRRIIFLASSLYVLNILFGTYDFLLPEQGHWNSRYGPAGALLFLSLGAYIRMSKPRIPTKLAASSAILFCALNIGEFVLIRHLGATYKYGIPENRLMTVPFGLSVFLLVLAISSEPANDWAVTRFLATLGKLSLGVYVSHLLILRLLKEFHLLQSPRILTAATVFCLALALTYVAQRTPLKTLFV